MADARISELIQRTPNGQEFMEVIIPPFTAGTNRKVLLSDLAAILSGGGHVIEDDGSPLPQRADLNFVGAGVTATDAGGKTVVTIPGGGAVDSVNGQTGVVVLDSGDIANTPAGGIAATDVQAALNELDTEKLDARATFRRETANHTLDATDLGNINGGKSLIIEMNVGSSNTVTIPLNATQAFPIGTAITLTQYGAGVTSVVATGGVTIRSSSGVLTSPGQYSPFVLEKVGTNEWYLWNGLQSSVASWQDWSASLTVTGFSSLTIQESWYKDDGNMVTIWWEISGTSNLTTFTFSLPIAISSNWTTLFSETFVFNGSATVAGRIEIAGGATLVTVGATAAGGAWTASGTKASRGFLVYQK